MDQQAEIRDFLASRRARLSPEDAGVPLFGGTRRVPGLRREEVAHLAGVSVDYYNRLERGRARGVSAEVLDAVARALQLDDVERDHLFDLFGTPAQSATRRPPRARPSGVRPTVQAVLDGLSMPAFVQNARLEMIAANQLGRALYAAPGEQQMTLPFSLPRLLFLDPRSADFYREPARVMRAQVALLRTAAGRDPDDEALVQLVGQLSTRSADFRTLWATHDVQRYREGVKRFRHPVVGDLDFVGESFELASDPSLVLLTYTVEPGSPTAEALRLLASWTAEAPVR
ncbi:helix-turn-helix transcriptional regulator [Nakamurella deserti]|uniref:helix-turn-helix transcriptional regulator n=1 Tax=Nakamurella deserti TaxID=2164074 RepID=UPI000DBE7CBB|nr:helix-turn-helix transcriptional regulator [Nakamurella deserti]